MVVAATDSLAQGRTRVACDDDAHAAKLPLRVPGERVAGRVPNDKNETPRVRERPRRTGLIWVARGRTKGSDARARRRTTL